MLDEYSRLPKTEPAHCFVCTAAAAGHPGVVHSQSWQAADGRMIRVNDQLRYLKAFELLWASLSPAGHRRVAGSTTASAPASPRCFAGRSWPTAATGCSSHWNGSPGRAWRWPFPATLGSSAGSTGRWAAALRTASASKPAASRRDWLEGCRRARGAGALAAIAAQTPHKSLSAAGRVCGILPPHFVSCSLIAPVRRTRTGDSLGPALSPAASKKIGPFTEEPTDDP